MNLVDKAARLAMVAHNGTNRDGDRNVPYIMHPHAIVALLKEWRECDFLNNCDFLRLQPQRVL